MARLVEFVVAKGGPTAASRKFSNLKFQITNNFQIQPKKKSQSGPTLEIFVFSFLPLNIWSLFGIWNLSFEISRRVRVNVVDPIPILLPHRFTAIGPCFTDGEILCICRMGSVFTLRNFTKAD
jgi:hypothetical protein